MNDLTINPSNNLYFTFKTSSEDDAKVRMCAHTTKYSCNFYTKTFNLLIYVK